MARRTETLQRYFQISIYKTSVLINLVAVQFWKFPLTFIGEIENYVLQPFQRSCYDEPFTEVLLRYNPPSDIWLFKYQRQCHGNCNVVLFISQILGNRSQWTRSVGKTATQRCTNVMDVLSTLGKRCTNVAYSLVFIGKAEILHSRIVAA